jgi:hypothetical protein
MSLLERRKNMLFKLKKKDLRAKGFDPEWLHLISVKEKKVTANAWVCHNEDDGTYSVETLGYLISVSPDPSEFAGNYSHCFCRGKEDLAKVAGEFAHETGLFGKIDFWLSRTNGNDIHGPLGKNEAIAELCYGVKAVLFGSDADAVADAEKLPDGVYAIVVPSPASEGYGKRWKVIDEEAYPFGTDKKETKSAAVRGCEGEILPTKEGLVPIIPASEICQGAEDHRIEGKKPFLTVKECLGAIYAFWFEPND